MSADRSQFQPNSSIYPGETRRWRAEEFQALRLLERACRSCRVVVLRLGSCVADHRAITTSYWSCFFNFIMSFSNWSNCLRSHMISLVVFEEITGLTLVMHHILHHPRTWKWESLTISASLWLHCMCFVHMLPVVFRSRCSLTCWQPATENHPAFPGKWSFDGGVQYRQKNGLVKHGDWFLGQLCNVIGPWQLFAHGRDLWHTLCRCCQWQSTFMIVIQQYPHWKLTVQIYCRPAFSSSPAQMWMLQQWHGWKLKGKNILDALIYVNILLIYNHGVQCSKVRVWVRIGGTFLAAYPLWQSFVWWEGLHPCHLGK